MRPHLLPLLAGAILLFAPPALEAQSNSEARKPSPFAERPLAAGVPSAAQPENLAAGHGQPQPEPGAPGVLDFLDLLQVFDRAPGNAAPQQAPAPDRESPRSATAAARPVPGPVTVTSGAPALPAALPAAAMAGLHGSMHLSVGKSLVVDSAARVQRISIANGEVAEAVAVSPRELLVHGKAAGETTLIVWQEGGRRQFFDLKVTPASAQVDAGQRQLDAVLGSRKVRMEVQGEHVVLTGTVDDVTEARRAEAIASAFGEVVNLLDVATPEAEAQILLKVRFANLDRTRAQDLGANLFSFGALNTIGGATTGQFSPPRWDIQDGARVTFTDALNIFLLRPDLNLGATIRALATQRVLEILAEPNLLTTNGKKASFLAGGEFPFPVLQGGANVGAVTITFKEFGIRINFTPELTPRGTIRLKVNPEVSSLDFANALLIQGFTIPAISTRRVETEIELESGQSFAIAGLLDQRTQEIMNKVPGIGDIPILGRLFQSRSRTRANSELLVMVTPEFVRPMPVGHPLPKLEMDPNIDQSAPTPRTPGIDQTGPVPVTPTRKTVPYDQLLEEMKRNGAASVNMSSGPGASPAAPGATQTAAGAGQPVPAGPPPAGGQ